MAVAGILAVIGLVWVVATVRSFLTSEAAAASSSRMFVDEKTGKAFRVTIKVGMEQPVQIRPAEASPGGLREELTGRRMAR